MSDEPFPCDLLLLHSDTQDNKCYITTANLDGETNLKVNFNILLHLTLKFNLIRQIFLLIRQKKFLLVI